jgi:GR25 family glycosyltransferase involved in LPS biosynthesis
VQFVGRYINMDSSPERRAAMERRLAGLGLSGRYSRFPAADGRALSGPGVRISAGELGCMVSHLGCIREAAERGEPTHVIEDDVVMTAASVPILEQILPTALAQWDMLFCDIVVPLHVNTLYTLLKLLREVGLDPNAAPGEATPRVVHYLPLEAVPFTGAASYVIGPAGAAKLAPLIAAHLEAGPTMPVDNLMQALCASGRITAACAAPFLTSVDPEAVITTTMSGRGHHGLSALALFLMRHHFYMGRDRALERRLAARLTEALADAEDTVALMEAIRFAFSEKFEIF